MADWSAAVLREMVAANTLTASVGTTACDLDLARDAFGRTLGRLYHAGTTSDASVALLRRGALCVYDYNQDASVPAAYASAQTAAQTEVAGLWSCLTDPCGATGAIP